MNEIIAFLRKKDYRITVQRKAILESLVTCGQFFSAQQVFDNVKRTYQDISFDTIYRNLNLFSAFGLLQQIHLPKGDGSVFEITEEPHPHLICLRCGKIQCVDNTLVDLTVINEALWPGFTICRYSLEFYGYCSECRDAQRLSEERKETNVCI
ncbi:Fur family transcriptional regulator [Propionispora vibrioides]|uniref:Zinc uptake regulator, Fur family n=1 Tax=Propionispora vibrioides TaxID=112903 RepID=A0A1H8XI15_9FIRM|nr:zinc uptake regulator, Fur family [Propionispora vibrioides]